jgi:hypothetical protein
MTALAALFRFVDASTSWLYQGGFLLAAAVSVSLVACTVISPRGGLSRGLSVGPLVWIGSISYGLYLWHWPIYVFVNEARTGLSGVPLLGLRLADTFAVATASFLLVERPLRTGWVASPKTVVGAFAAASAVTATVFLVSTSYVSGIEPSLHTVTASAGAPRVLVAGDSSAFSLAEHYDGVGDFNVSTVAILGCGVVRGQNQPLAHPAFSNRAQCDDWPERWARAEGDFAPDVTLVGIGAWEVFDKKVDGQVLAVGSPAWKSYVASELEVAVTQATVDGRPLVFLNVPCYHSVSSLQGEPNPEQDDPARVAAVNGVLDDLQAAHPDAVTVLDLHSLLCPDGRYTEKVDGVVARSDGIHFTEAGARLVWEWLAPQLDAVVGRTG